MFLCIRDLRSLSDQSRSNEADILGFSHGRMGKRIDVAKNNWPCSVKVFCASGILVLAVIRSCWLYNRQGLRIQTGKNFSFQKSFDDRASYSTSDEEKPGSKKECARQPLMISDFSHKTFFTINNDSKLHAVYESESVHLSLGQDLGSATVKNATNSTKPHLYLHVGPPKTGSSTLQAAWGAMSDINHWLERDNLYYRRISRSTYFDCIIADGQYVDCLASKRLKSLLRRIQNSGGNLLLSDECLGEQFSPILRSIIDDLWDVTVIVVYRRVHEMLASLYNQRNKATNRDADGNVLLDSGGIPYRQSHTVWPDQGGKRIPDFSAWYRQYTNNWKSDELVSKHRSVALYNTYKQLFSRVIVYDMHHPQFDIVTDFMCGVISDAPETCQRLRCQEVPFSIINPSVHLEYDIVAVHAYDQGFVDKGLSRVDTVSAVARFVEKTGMKILHRCETNVTSQIWDWTLGTEREMFWETWSSSNEEELLHSFESHVARGKICDVDKEAVLANEVWINFFRSLGARN